MSSDSSLDSELLAAAGAKKKGGKKRKAVSSEEEDEEEVSSEEVSLDDESDWEEKRPASKKKGGASKPPARKRQARGRGRKAATSEEEEEEEEEQGGGGGESSDEEDRLEIDEDDLIEDEEDRKRLAAMTELQREFELANRAEKRNAEMLRQKLLKKDAAGAAAAERAGAKAAKRVGRAKSGREEREEAAKKSAMEELKAARERKARGAEERARRRSDSEEPEAEGEGGEGEGRERSRRRGREASDEEEEEEGALRSDDDMSEDDRNERLYGRRGPGEEGEDEEDEAPVEDVRKIQVKRQQLEEWVNEPFFEDTLPGCMVKVKIDEFVGADGRPQVRYLLSQVVAVEARPPGWYKDPGKSWKSPYNLVSRPSEKTSKWLLLERGTSQRHMPIALISNEDFSEQEFESWQRNLKEQGRPQVSRRVAKDTLERLTKAKTYTYTDADVQRLLKEKKAKGLAPRNAALEKARLENQLANARENAAEPEVIAELERQVASLDALLAETAAAGKRGRADVMAALNKRNADANFKNALDNVSNKVAGAGGAQDLSASQLDPFSRRATRPMIYWSTKRQTGEEAAQEGDANGSAAADQQQANGEAEAAGEGQKKRGGKLDLDSIVDLSALDLTALDRPSRLPPLARKLLGPTWRPDPMPPGARIISLEEYRRSKGW